MENKIEEYLKRIAIALETIGEELSSIDNKMADDEAYNLKDVCKSINKLSEVVFAK